MGLVLKQGYFEMMLPGQQDLNLRRTGKSARCSFAELRFDVTLLRGAGWVRTIDLRGLNASTLSQLSYHAIASEGFTLHGGDTADSNPEYMIKSHMCLPVITTSPCYFVGSPGFEPGLDH